MRRDINTEGEQVEQKEQQEHQNQQDTAKDSAGGADEQKGEGADVKEDDSGNAAK